MTVTFSNVTRPDGRTMVTLTNNAADELTGPYAVSLFRCASCFIIGIAPEPCHKPATSDFTVTSSRPFTIICTTCGKDAG